MPSRDLILKILGDSLGAQRALKEAQKDLKETGEHAEKTGKHFGGLGKFAAVAGGAAGVGLLVEGLKGAVEAASVEQQSQAKLDTALRTTHQSVTKMKPALEEAAAAGRKMGFSDGEIESSLAKLEIATGSTKKSTEELSTAQDIARFKHIDLEAATKMLVMAQTGSQRAMKQLGLEVQASTDNQDKLRIKYQESEQALKDQFPSLSKMTQAQRDHYDALKNNLDLQYQADKQDAKIQDHNVTGAAIIAQVTDKVKGQAEAYSNTAAGGMATFKVQMEHLQATIGEKLIPVITLLLTGLNNAVAFIEQHWPQISAVFDKVAGAVETAWNTVGRPVFEAVVDFARKAIDFVRDHWDEISAKVREVFNTIKTIVDTTTDVITTLWRTFGGTIKTIIGNDIDAVKDVFSGLFTSIKGVFNLIDDLIHGRWSQIWGDMKQIVSGAIDAAVGVLTAAVKNVGAVAELIGKALKNGITGALSGIGGIISELVRGAINQVIDLIDSIHIPAIKILGHQVFGGFDFNIPHLASGGIVNRPTLAMIGEAGPEAVVPLGRGGGLGNTFIINGDTYDVDRLADRLHAALLRKQQSNGGRLGFA